MVRQLLVNMVIKKMDFMSNNLHILMIVHVEIKYVKNNKEMGCFAKVLVTNLFVIDLISVLFNVLMVFICITNNL